MKRRLVAFLAWTGGLVLLALALLITFLVMTRKPTVPGQVLLELDLKHGLVEVAHDDGLGFITKQHKQSVQDVVFALERAAGDARVTGLIADVGIGELGFAQVQEVRDAVIAFRKHGKRAIAFADTFGELSVSLRAYYLATAFDEIHLQPSGSVGLTGLMVAEPFIRGTLDKIGAVPRFDHRYEYKNAMNLFTEKKYTPAHKEASQRLIDSISGQMVRDIAEARHLAPESVTKLIAGGPYGARAALDAKLVDALAYRDEVYDKVKQSPGGKLLYLSQYLERAGSPYKSGTTVAVIYGVGGVQRGEGEYDLLNGSEAMGSDTVTAAFRAAIDDSSVKAILFRVDSPGGSAVASDSIWRETQRARKAGKPVVVTMGNVAGSGGYYVAMGADRIIAQPATITGSIGVLGGKMVTAGLWEKLGVSWDSVTTAPNGSMWSSIDDYTPEEWKHLQEWLDRVYVEFTTKVAEGRKLPKDKVLAIAKGRVWTGEDAKERGLVDALGGYATALGELRKLLKLGADAPLELKTFPAQRSRWQALLAREPENSDQRGRAGVHVGGLAEARALGRLAAALGVGPGAGELTMPVPLFR